MAREVSVRELAAQPILGKRYRTSMEKIGEDIGGGYGELFGYLGELGESPSGAPFVLYFGTDAELDPNDFEMEVCVPVNRVLEDRGDIAARELEGGLAASTIHKGPYSEMEAVYGEMDAWMRENGYEYAGPVREVYMNDPGQVAESELVTEIIFPVRKA